MINFTCRIITEFQDLERYAGDWARLQNNGERRDIFQDFDWIQAWWHTLGKKCRVFTPIVSRADRVIAILPLVLDGRDLRFLGYNVSDYNYFLAESDDAHKALESCLSVLFENNQHWDRIRVENVPASTRLADCVRRLPAMWRRDVVEAISDGCPTMLLDDHRVETLKKCKSKLKSVVKRLARDGKLEFRHIENKSELDEHLRHFFRQHIERSAIAGRQSNFLDKHFVAFYASLLERFEVSSKIRFSVLEINGHPVSYHFGFQYAGKYLFYKPTFDVDFWDLSPGQVLLSYVFEYLEASDVKEFDFGRGDESYKQRFANHVRQNITFTIYGRSYRSQALKWVEKARGTLMATLKRSPRVESFARRIQTYGQEVKMYQCRHGTYSTIKKVLWEPIFSKQEYWLVAVDAKGSKWANPDAVSVRKGSLSELAYRSVDTPNLLTDRELLAARNLIRQKKTPWIISEGSLARAIVWTMTDALEHFSDGAIPRKENVMLAVEIWSLRSGDAESDTEGWLRQLIPIAESKNLTLWAIPPKQLMASAKSSTEQDVMPMYQFTRTCLFGRCTTAWRTTR